MTHLPTLAEIDAALDVIRKNDDAKLPDCPLISPAMRQIPPQRAGIAHILLRPRFVVADPTGCGKTPTTLAAFAFIKQKQPLAKLWVFAKRSAQDQWADSVRTFLPTMRVEVLGFDPRKPNTERDIIFRREQYRRFAANELDVVISTYQMPAQDLSTVQTIVSRTRAGKEVRKRVYTPQPPPLDHLLVAFDEAHYLRGHTGTLYWPFHRALSERAARVVALTATPLMGSLDDIYAIYEVVRPGTFHTDYKAFFDQYYRWILVPRKQGGKFKKIIGVQNIAHLRETISRFIIQRPPSAFDKYLPSVSFQYRMAELHPLQRRAYDTFAQQVIPPLVDTGYKTAQRLVEKQATGDSTITAQISALSYLQMVVDAPECLGLADVPCAKADELIEYLQHSRTTEKVLVFTRYEQVATALMARFARAGLKADRITGKESGPARTAARKRFQEQPDSWLLTITSAGGESQDLQAAGVLVFYDLPWSWGEFLQVVGRARRIGSTVDRILCLLLGAARTLDTHTLAILRRKEKLALATGLSVSDLSLREGDDSLLIDDASTSAIVSRSLAADLFQAVANDLSGTRTVSPYDDSSQNGGIV